MAAMYNHSLVIRVAFGEASFLFTGDLETRAIETLVEYYEGSGLLDVDVYQVGHHGSYNGTSDEIMRAIVRPEIAVIAASAWALHRSANPVIKRGSSCFSLSVWLPDHHSAPC